MIIYEKVHGTQDFIEPIEINVDTVYKRNNIKQIKNAEGNLVWEYDEIQMSIEEYLKEAVPNNQKDTDNALAELMQIFCEYQTQMDKTVAELSILIGGLL